MAALRNTSKGFSTLLRTQQQVTRRSISTRAGARSFYKPVMVGACGAVATYGIYSHYKNRLPSLPSIEIDLPTPVVHAAAPACQPSVITGTKDHALYLWIHLRSEADVKACARVVADLQSHVDAVCPPDMRDEDDEVLAGVGFGPGFYAKAAGRSFFGLFQIAGKAKKDYTFETRAGAHGTMPAEGGDIFVHAKCNQISKLFELAQRITNKLPEGSIAKVVDVYGWVYQNGRDLSGFIDGTENAADDEQREEVAVENGSGGSYVIAQRWVHNLDKINRSSDAHKESWVGRQIDDSSELKDKSITSHVARMTGGNNFEQKKAFEIVRQSQPYGTISGKAGLFFIGYSKSPENLNYMLDRMVGKGKEDNHHDDIMRLTTCEASTYWYFPGQAELKNLK